MSRFIIDGTIEAVMSRLCPPTVCALRHSAICKNATSIAHARCTGAAELVISDGPVVRHKNKPCGLILLDHKASHLHAVALLIASTHCLFSDVHVGTTTSTAVALRGSMR